MPKGQEKEVSKTYSSLPRDIVKETRDVSNILSLLDSHVVKTNPFGANVTGDASYRRAERISAALHLITNHVPENEPLRVAIRQGALDLLVEILDLRAGFRTPSSEKGQVTLASIRKLISLVRFLAVGGFVSPQNVAAVAEALDELGSLIIVSQKSTLSEQMNIAREDLVPPVQDALYSPRPTSSKNNHTKSSSRSRRQDIKDTIGSQTDTTTSNRSEQVMDILKAGGVLGIRDISANLPQYSEKMIQRELAELVLMNKVVKMGAKRWSRYQIAL